MKTPLPLITLLAAAALAGCDTSPETIGGSDVPNVTNEVANVQLPPSIVASHKYRCGDNSVLAIDWLSDGTTNSARVTPEGGEAVTVTQVAASADPEGDNIVASDPVAGGDYTAEGATLSGNPTDTSVTFNGQSCKR
jgi:hypothetical protein